MSFVADLHLHSSYAYATSSALSLENLALWAGYKGIDLLSTADFTHPRWIQELKSKLVESPNGAYRYQGVAFVMGTEVSCVFRQDGRGRRIHLLVFAPSIEVAEKLTASFARYGNLHSDGRPTLALSAADATSVCLETDPGCLVIPAHAWTPWYGIFGSKSGFDSLPEAFGDMLEHIPAIETGLSSDPEMNWSVPELADKAIVSFSDAHSLPKLGRELTVFAGEPGFEDLERGLKSRGVEFTVEMYPEEGKYHFDGHRKCGVSFDPARTRREGDNCPNCGRAMTLGVAHRVMDLAGSTQWPAASSLPTGTAALPTCGVPSPEGRPTFVRMVPLIDIISAARNRGPATRGVLAEYQQLVSAIGSEYRTLLWAPESELSEVSDDNMADAILRVRRGEIHVEPGYDGVYGKVSIEK
ncbi:MAG: endonuclease Q family protein [Chloroflexota bacterium]|nr:endonuclease Q family protein [Chloroflexota bacterium]